MIVISSASIIDMCSLPIFLIIVDIEKIEIIVIQEFKKIFLKTIYFPNFFLSFAFQIIQCKKIDERIRYFLIKKSNIQKDLNNQTVVLF